MTVIRYYSACVVNAMPLAAQLLEQLEENIELGKRNLKQIRRLHKSLEAMIEEIESLRANYPKLKIVFDEAYLANDRIPRFELFSATSWHSVFLSRLNLIAVFTEAMLEHLPVAQFDMNVRTDLEYHLNHFTAHHLWYCDVNRLGLRREAIEAAANGQPREITIKELGGIVGKSEKTIYAWIKKGRIPRPRNPEGKVSFWYDYELIEAEITIK